MDRVTSVTRPDETTVRFDWDLNGNLEVLTVPSNVDHGFAYNKVDKNTAYDPPLSPSYRYEYDRDRRLVRTVFPSGQAIENVYENGQLRRVITPEGYKWEARIRKVAIPSPAGRLRRRPH